jgi:hypothetical protein
VGPGPSESESSETESEDSDSSESESGESNPFDMGSRRRGPLTSSSSDSDSSTTSSDSGESGSSSADSGFAKPSSSDTEVDFTPSAPSLEETEEFGRKVTGLSGRARWQVRKLLAVLTRMRKNLPPSARIEAVRRLGWRLGPGIEACRAIAEGSDPRPTQVPEGGDQIRKFLEEWEQKYKESEERYRAERDEAFRSDDEMARAEGQLAAKEAAELEERAKVVQQRLPVITARLGILWNEVTGSSRPMPSEVRLTSTGTEMTAEEHVATAETHLRYAEGHLQPTEEHMADAEVHLKLVKAHLAALVTMEPLETEPFKTAALPPVGPTSNEAGTDREEAAPVESRDPTPGSRAGLAERGSGSDGKTLRPGAGEHWACPISKCRDSATHPLDECGEFKRLSVPQRKKAIKEWNRCECCLLDCRDRKTGSRCYRRVGFRRHHLLGLVPQAKANQVGSKRCQQQQPRRKTAKGGQNTPQGEPDQDDSGRSRGQGILPRRQTDMWSFPAFSKDKELVWLRATRSQHVSATRIMHQAAVRLGLAQSVTEAYQVQLRFSSEPRFVLRAEGVETLECIRSRSERRSARALQPDVIIGWPDWSKVQPFVMSRWAVSGQTPPGATAPATKWHLRMNRKGGPPMYLNVELDPMRQRSTITHEAAVRIGMQYEPFYMLFARAEDGEVRNLIAVGADAMVRADKRRPADLASKGPDLLMDAKDAGGMAKCLRPGWKSGEEIGGRGGCPVEGQWHGKLKGRLVLRDPGWTCLLFVKTGGANQDIFMRVMFDTIREQSVVLHSVAVKLGLRASRGPTWLNHPGEDPRYSSCVYEVPVLDWKGRRDWIKARGVSYATPSEQRDMPEGAMEAFPEISLSGVTVSQAAGPVDMIIGRDNPEWMPVPVQEEPYEWFTLMWTSLSPRCILKDNEEVEWRL